MMQNKHILLGVSGGIAAYKACALTSKLTQQGAQVKVIMTRNAEKFVSPLTFQALSRNPVHTDTFDEKDPEKIAHIDLADWADITILAPATANIIGKLASGIADDMLSTVLLASQSTVYIAPAMNVHMYAHPAVMQNMQQLETWGYHFIEPGDGYLACGYVGKGRLEEPESIITAIDKHYSGDSTLAGKRVLISAGPTQEKIDPVRFFTNHSTGKMGFALAEAAANLGADVTLVTGPVNLTVHHQKISRIDVVTSDEMYEKMHEYFSQNDIVIKAAAVADYKPKEVHSDKLKKQSDDWHIEMERTEDILQSLGDRKGEQFLAGFAAETNQPVAYGIQKLQKKHLDAVIINDLAADGVGFGGSTNAVTYVNSAQDKHELTLKSKQAIADEIMSLIAQDIKAEASDDC